MSSVGDIQSIPAELFAKFQTSFYADPKDAVFKHCRKVIRLSARAGVDKVLFATYAYPRN